MVFDILRQIFTTIKRSFNLAWAIAVLRWSYRSAMGSHPVYQLFQNLRHRTVQIDLHYAYRHWDVESSNCPDFHRVSQSRYHPCWFYIWCYGRRAKTLPKPTGHDAPWRGRRMIRTSCARYLPPNCAPRPILWASSSTCFQVRYHELTSVLLPVVGNSS